MKNCPLCNKELIESSFDRAKFYCPTLYRDDFNDFFHFKVYNFFITPTYHLYLSSYKIVISYETNKTLVYKLKNGKNLLKKRFLIKLIYIWFSNEKMSNLSVRIISKT
jgi:hypothetical protein